MLARPTNYKALMVKKITLKQGAPVKPTVHRILSTSGAARALGLNENTVRRLADDGTIECQRDQSGKRLFTQTQLDTFMQQRQSRGRRRP